MTPLFCKLLGDSGFVPWDTNWLGLCGRFSHADSEAGSLLSQAYPVCYLAFQEDDAF